MPRYLWIAMLIISERPLESYRPNTALPLVKSMMRSWEWLALHMSGMTIPSEAVGR